MTGFASCGSTGQHTLASRLQQFHLAGPLFWLRGDLGALCGYGCSIHTMTRSTNTMSSERRDRAGRRACALRRRRSVFRYVSAWGHWVYRLVSCGVRRLAIPVLVYLSRSDTGALAIRASLVCGLGCSVRIVWHRIQFPSRVVFGGSFCRLGLAPEGFMRHNQAHALNGAERLCLHFARYWRGTSDAGRWRCKGAHVREGP